MSPPISPSRRRKLRRFSSVSPSGPVGWSIPQSLARSAATLGRRRGRQTSLSPPATTTGIPFHGGQGEDSDMDDPFDHPPSMRSAPSHRHMYLKEEERSIPRVYSSLPPTPISSSPPPHPFDRDPPPPLPKFETEVNAEPIPNSAVPFSLWDYLREELLATDFDSHQELKWERVSNFLSIPLAMEKIMTFGFIVCLDSFLYTFTILPIRFMFALFRFVTNIFRFKPPSLPPSQKADILRALLLIVSILILNPLTDASKIYHTIRGQDTIKLYVIFNALEVRFFSIALCLKNKV
ncbi:hypothetical protein H0H81_011347 [Sphagnurus paluster]|uniref:Uncharacterized protein n=1 Tax=Sphagnurus paluster TaxID=117069 RepID=A0A9P7FYD9_9AGAR|nr:hypothetical protein H0H81_011347 [Sphagnurus paluster]